MFSSVEAFRPVKSVTENIIMQGKKRGEFVPKGQRRRLLALVKIQDFTEGLV